MKFGIKVITALVNTPENIEEIRDLVGESEDSNLLIFARIETSQAICNFDSILEKMRWDCFASWFII